MSDSEFNLDLDLRFKPNESLTPITVCFEYTVSGETIPEVGLSFPQSKTVLAVLLQFLAELLISGLTSCSPSSFDKCRVALSVARAKFSRERLDFVVTGSALLTLAFSG